MTIRTIAPITMYFDAACVVCSTEAQNMQARNPSGIRLIPVNEGINELTVAGFSRADAMTYSQSTIILVQGSRAQAIQ